MRGLSWPLSVPVLSDGVVTLRAHTPADVDAMLEMAAGPGDGALTPPMPDPQHP